MGALISRDPSEPRASGVYVYLCTCMCMKMTFDAFDALRSTQLGNPAVSVLIACKDIITVKVQSVSETRDIGTGTFHL
jgi:hypothetical protein